MPVPELPDFRISPDPPPFKTDTSMMASTVPVDMRLQAPAVPGDISVPKISVSRNLTNEVVPNMFGAQGNEKDDVEKAVDESVEQNGSRSGAANDEWVEEGQEQEKEEVSIAIEDTKLHRLLLHHALLGFTFGTAPFCLRTLLEAAPPSAVKDMKEPIDARARRLQESAAQFKHDMLVLNMHALSILLASSSGWTFTIALEASPYYGYGGLEARLCLYGPSKKHLSFHLVGVANPTEDIPKLANILKTLCPTARLKCLGVVTDLNQKEHAMQLGAMVSAVIVYFSRLAPRTRPFYTPDRAMQGNRPPLFPAELATASRDDVANLVSNYRNMLEVSRSADDIAQILKDHEAITKAPKETLKIKDDSDKMTDEEPGKVKASLDDFDKAWEVVGSRFSKLREFAGGLSTAHLYTPKSRSRVGITALEVSEDTWSANEVSTQAADVVLHARQFEELRSYLVR